MNAPAAMVANGRLATLHSKQTQDPTNLILAHDLGLAHYWQAKKQVESEDAVPHWQQVIANWALVLASDSYWQQWANERSQVYERDITTEHTTAVRKSLQERLSLEMGNYPVAPLEPLFFLEITTIRLLQQHGGQLLNVDQHLFDCGPLLVIQLSLQTQITAFFRHRFLHGPASLQTVLTLIQWQTEPTESQQLVWQIQLCFSELGLAFIALLRNRPMQALERLQQICCPHCVGQQKPGSPQIDNLPEPCQPDCSHFAQANAAYAAIVNGSTIFGQDAAALSIGAHLLLARRALNNDPFAPSAIVTHFRTVAQIATHFGWDDILTPAIADKMLAWSDDLEQHRRWDDAIALLEQAEEFDQSKRWQGKLAGALSVRGIISANEHQDWEQAAADLRAAYKLNPYLTNVQRNLANVLVASAQKLYQQGDHTLAREQVAEAATLMEEAVVARPDDAKLKEELNFCRWQLVEWESEVNENAHWDFLDKVLADDTNLAQPGQTTPIEPPVVPSQPKLMLSPAQQANLALFNASRSLQLERFSARVQEVIWSAWETAVSPIALHPLSLLYALTKPANAILNQLLTLQSYNPEQLHRQIQAYMAPLTRPVDPPATLTLDHFDFHQFKPFSLAWEMASYDQQIIEETYLLCALLIYEPTAKWLQQAGVDVAQMTRQIGWC